MAQKTLTAAGNAQLDTAQKKFGTASLLCDGTNDGASIPDDADFEFGSGDFTMECFVRFNGNTGAQVFLSKYNPAAQNDHVWYIDFSANQMHFAYSTDGTNNTDTGFAWTPSVATWYHVAVCRNGANLRCFVDGSQIGSTLNVSTNSFFNGNQIYAVGIDTSLGVNSLNGWMDELRVTKGLARYTGNFTPPTSKFTYDANNVLLCHFDGADASTTFTDSSADITDIIASGEFFSAQM
jgi:hypothetical protein